MEKDEIVIQLSNRLINFIEFFKNDLQKKVLELDTNSKSAEFYIQLRRVSNSLEQYLKKDINLFYVGFLGSYSSGKSSTINSLLNLWKTDRVRRVSNNPTDDCINLITNQKNVDSVFTFSKEGTISIRTNTNFEIDFLNNLVIMDTPGSGDPNIVETIVRDSLPLCDLIIYTLNATAPFTDIDKPFLIAQQKKLKSIPILFVITRGDEFKISNSIELSQENFDNKKYQTELQTLISRINEVINISNFTEKDFIVIDNHSNFNIDKLKKIVYQFTSEADKSLILLHNHKLNHFKTEIDEIHNFYLDLSDSKIEKCQKFIEKAHSNIDYFDNQIELSKTKFKSIWNEYFDKISRIFDGTAKGYLDNLLNDLKQYELFNISIGFNELYDANKIKIKNEAENESQKIKRDIEEKAFEIMTSLKQEIMNLINYEKFSITSNNLNKENELTVNLTFPINCKEFNQSYKTCFETHYNDSATNIKKVFNQINKNIKLFTPIDKIEENITNYILSTFEILETYYAAIKMYNIAAFSYDVKSYISELGIGKEFDNVDLDEINKAEYNLRTKKILTQEIILDISKFKEEITKLTNLTEKYALEIENLDLNLKIDEFEFEYNLDNTDDKKSISSFVNDLYEQLITNSQNQLFKLSNDIDKLKKIRLKKYIFVAIITTLLGCLVFLTFTHFKNINISNNSLVTILVGISTSIIATLITRFFDKFKSIKLKFIDEFKSKLFEDNTSIVNNFNAEFKNRNVDRQKEIAKSIFNNWENNFDSLIRNVENQNKIYQDKNLLKLNTETIIIVEQYRNIYSKLNDQLLVYFSNIDDNFEKVTEIANQIKNESIKPSFNLLKNTLADIEDVKKQIGFLKK